MAHDDKDRLADLLGQMADGHHDDEPAHPHDQAAQPAPAPAPAPAPNLPRPQPSNPPAARRPAPPQKAPLPSVQPRANAPLPPQPVAPRPAAMRQSAAPIPRQVPPPPAAGRPAPPPIAQPAPLSQVVNQPVDEDDAVIVPAPPASALAHTHTHRPHQVHPARGMNINVKRTMIPILLTLGLEMFALIALGALSPADSIFRMFTTPAIAITLGFLGMLFIPAALFLMLQVSNELARRAAR